MNKIQFARYFETGNTATIAEQLLGVPLLYDGPAGMVGGYIVEAEAYLGAEDKAAHAYQAKRTKKSAPLFMGPGTIYTYQIHRQVCFDIVTQPAGEPQGILIRAIEPMIGLPQMMMNRPVSGVNLTNGPGKLMQAMGLDMQFNMQFLPDTPVRLAFDQRQQPQTVVADGRIGIANKAEWADKPLRFSVAHNPYVSKIKKADVDQMTHGWQSIQEDAK